MKKVLKHEGIQLWIDERYILKQKVKDAWHRFCESADIRKAAIEFEKELGI